MGPPRFLRPQSLIFSRPQSDNGNPGLSSRTGEPISYQNLSGDRSSHHKQHIGEPNPLSNVLAGAQGLPDAKSRVRRSTRRALEA